MNDDGRFFVDDFADSGEWEERDGPLAVIRYWALYDGDGMTDVDFVVELVHEIERLQTENITLGNELKYFKDRIGLPDIIPYPHDDFCIGYT